MLRGAQEIARIRELLAQHPKGLTIEEVSRRLCLNRATAAKYLNALAVSGQADLRALGPAKVYYSSHRLPLADLMSFSSDLILVLDDEFTIIHANDTLLDHFGVEAGEVKGRRLDRSPLAPYLDDVDIDRIHLAIDGSEEIFDCEVGRGGVSRFYRGRALPLVFDAGTRGIGVILEDVTSDRRHKQELELRVRERTRELEAANAALEREIEDRRRTEARLSASRHTVRQILETTPNLVYVYSMETATIRYANPNLTSMLGYPVVSSWKSEGTGFLRLVHPDDLPILKAHREALSASADGEVCEAELRVQHAHGHYLVLRCRELVFKWDDTGRPRLVIGTAEDVTELRRASNALRTAHRQLQLLNSITRHDILNHINILTGSLRLAQEKAGAAAENEHIDRALHAAETIRRQITFTRDYQSIGSRPPEWQNLGAMIERAWAVLTPDGARLEIVGCDVDVYTDRLFERALQAMIENAVRHGGTVERIRFGSGTVGERLAIVCEDDGIGIPEAEKDRIFERSYGRNSGFGLFFVREILAITGLSIRETGSPGEGARFEILVPHGQYRTPAGA